MIDAHIHLEQYEHADTAIENWMKAGVKKVVAVSNDLASSYRTLELKEKYPEFILAGVGFHPEKGLPHERDVEEWENLIAQERDQIACVGEVGLPHYKLEHLGEPFEEHIAFLTRCVHTASKYELPVALHAVHDKAKTAYDILQKEAPELSAHFHWLKAEASVVQSITDAGYYVSLTPEVCYRKRDQELAKRLPHRQLLIETDGPWPFQGPFARRQTTPLFLKEVAACAADTIGESADFFYKQTVRNTLRLYGG
ncbi:TatD DNase family protein [Alteribacillus persepolensis]|uniref:TatD DNase family protein n=1 Tax=Alteribacillus persepolensis TaxID=568899 RepID=A0A1G8ES19_9BACI|nr:TatD family hydrolase [Alteribacillus persepolensis]SDH72701.1 TatD DNase family protein [Alteribacillus persepolensis]